MKRLGLLCTTAPPNKKWGEEAVWDLKQAISCFWPQFAHLWEGVLVGGCWEGHGVA